MDNAAFSSAVSYEIPGQNDGKGPFLHVLKIAIKILRQVSKDTRLPGLPLLVDSVFQPKAWVTCDIMTYR